MKKVAGLYLEDGLIRSSLPEGNPAFSLDPATFTIKGVHNVENAMAAALIAVMAGASPESVARALVEFPGLEHRLEPVRELNGVRYVNDSKGTNVGAVLKSLEGYREPVVLIAGGRDKDSDFTLLRPVIKGRVKKLVLVGDAAEKIAKAVGDLTDTAMAGYDFRRAIEIARDAAAPGDVVLLSPSCASFDMFRDYEDRGRQFKEIVRSL